MGMTSDELKLADDLTTYNMVKELLVNSLASEGYLSREQASEIKNKYIVVVVKKNWLGKAISALMGSKDSSYIIITKRVL